MSPRRPRRRARRRSPGRPIVLLVAATIVLALLVGGLIRVSRQSQGYDANSNRSLAAQGGVVAEQSNVTASQVRSLMGTLQTQDRQGLQSSLDTAVLETARQSAAARTSRRARRRRAPSPHSWPPSSPSGPGPSATSGAQWTGSSGCNPLLPPEHPPPTRPPRRAPPASPPSSRRHRPRTASPRPVRCCPVPTASTARCSAPWRRRSATPGSPRRSGSAIRSCGRWARWRRRST